MKQPWKLLLFVLAVAFCIRSVFFSGNLGNIFNVEVNEAAISGGFTILMIVITDVVFTSGFKGGALLFSTADVNFSLAGPFSPKFNLFMSAFSGMKSCFLLLFILCSMAGVFTATLGISTEQMLIIIVLAAVNMIITHFLSALCIAVVGDNDRLRKGINRILLFINLLVIICIIIALFIKSGSISGAFSMSAKDMMSVGGNLIVCKLFPIAGWVGILFDGIYYGNQMRILLGTALTVLSFAAVMILLLCLKLDYYEISLETAMKTADMKEALRAGIDGDNIIVNSMASVGNSHFDKGWGATVLIFRHFIENSRLSRLSFVNTQALLYRIFGAIYLAVLGDFFTSWMGDVGIFVGGTLMMMVLNAIVFCGGKTVLEFNKPYIFLIPETSSKKLLCCVISDLPEMLIDSALCLGLLAFFARDSVDAGILIMFYVTMLVFDLMCELVAIILIRLLRVLGRFSLMLVRYFVVYVLVLVVMIPSMIFVLVNEVSIVYMYLAMSVSYGLLFLLLLLLSRNIIDSTEMNI